MEKALSKGIDFDRWSTLANSDPDAFEAERQALLDSVIEKAPEERQQRLRCLQWRIEHERSHSTNPVSACVRLSNMMWESVQRQQDMLDTLFHVSQGQEVTPEHSSCAKVLPFKPPRLSD